MGSFTDIEYANRKKKTKREEFLDQMDSLIPWERWISLIEPHYFKGRRGRPPRGIEPMLRMHLLQCWFNLSDEGAEDATCDSYALKKFSRLDFYEERVPDATTLLKFRHLLEKHGLCKRIFDDLNALLEKCGLMMRGGSIMDATIFEAASSTKNKENKRDEEMRQTKKGGRRDGPHGHGDGGDERATFRRRTSFCGRTTRWPAGTRGTSGLRSGRR